MVITIFEIILVLIQMLFESIVKVLDRAIAKINNYRARALDKYGSDTHIWEDYDGKEDRYKFLEKKRMKSNIIIFLGILVFAIPIFIYIKFGIELFPPVS